MICIKSTAPAPNDRNWSYGPGYMAQIGDKTAKALCGMYPLPKTGHEVIVAIRPDKRFPSFKNRLMVCNVSGSYFVASCDAPIKQWPDVFGVTVKGA